MKFALSSTLLLCLISQADYAAGYSTENDYYQEFPVVLSASRLSQPLSDAPNAMTVIDRQMIVDSGFRTIPDLFKLVPGMYVSYYKGSQAFVSYHGSTDQYARRMQVMIDGRSVYLPPASTVDWANLPITVEDIERIEVIRGPAAASHGANSTQGVISITTRDPGAMDGKQLSITRGAKGVNDVSTRFGKRGKTFDYRMTVAYTADNGYDNITGAKFAELLNNSYDSNQARMVNFRADYHPAGVDRYDIQFGFNHDVMGAGWNDKTPYPANPFSLLTNSTNTNTLHPLFSNASFVQLGWLRQLNDRDELSLRYYHVRQEQHEAFPIYYKGLFLSDPVVQSSKIDRDELELQHTLSLSDTNRLVYGAAWRRDQLAANGYASALALLGQSPAYAASIQTDEYRLFAHNEWRILPSLVFNAGAMLEKNGLGQTNSSPRAALNYHLTPQQTLRMGVSVAYRTPATSESRFRAINLGTLFVPNATVTSPALLPERMLSREIGYLGEFREWDTSLDLRLFSDQLDNGIYYDKVTSLSFVNGLNAHYQGVEATLKHNFTENSHLTVNFAHELASSNGPVLAAAGQSGLVSRNPLNNDILSASTPRNSASLQYAQQLRHGYSVSGAYYFTDAMQPFDRGPLDYQPIQRRFDLRLARAFNAAQGLKGNVALVVQNLFNQRYTEYVAQNVFNQRGHVTLTLDW